MSTSRVPVTAAPIQFFGAALRGVPCQVLGLEPGTNAMATHRWTGPADVSDRMLLSQCVGDTIDLGCGPGRMAEALAGRGLRVLGVDLSSEAVRQARNRGVDVVQRDIFGPLPRESRWGTALLADGNIGIGGDPGRLLTRVRGLVAPGGRVVLDLAPPGTGLRRHTLRLSVGGRSSHPFPWAVLGVDAVRAVALEADLLLSSVLEWHGRWFAVLRAGRGRRPCAR